MDSESTAASTDCEEIRMVINRPLTKHISRCPIKCPDHECGQTIDVSSLFAHFIRDHNKSSADSFQEIVGRDKRVLIFSESMCSQHNENICLGVLAYGGPHGRKYNAATQLSIRNEFLPDKFNHFANHLLILIMACRTHVRYLFTSKFEGSLEKNKQTDIIVIWLTSTECVKPIKARLKLSDESGKTSRAVVIKIRDIKLPQRPWEFLATDFNRIVLNSGEIELLTRNKNELELEINIE